MSQSQPTYHDSYVPPPYVPTGEWSAENVSPPYTYKTGATARWVTCKCGEVLAIFDHTLQEADRNKIRIHCWAPTVDVAGTCARVLYCGGTTRTEREVAEALAAIDRRDRLVGRVAWGAAAAFAIILAAVVLRWFGH